MKFYKFDLIKVLVKNLVRRDFDRRSAPNLAPCGQKSDLKLTIHKTLI